MPRIESEPCERMHVLLYTTDAARLKELYADNVGVSKAVRSIIRMYLKRLEEKLETEGASCE